jgi:hypothetical protein
MAFKMKDEEDYEELSPDDIMVDGKFYQGNENILRKDGTFKWTEEMIADFKLCNKSILHFAENHFCIVSLDRGKEKIELYKYQKRLLKAFKSNRFNVVLSSRQSGKALDINTLIPTPRGNVKMGDLKDGDQIYGLDGNVYNVIKAHDFLYNRNCYKVIFDNGEEIIADEDHLWFTQERLERKKKLAGSVKTTKEILNTLTVGSKKEPRHRIPMARNGIMGKKTNLPIDPYVLGLWLGDGNTDGANITVGPRDVEFLLEKLNNNKQFNKITLYQFKERLWAINPTHTDKKQSLWSCLKQNNLLGNKHIPDTYFTCSREQRLELLRGLMDSDGYISHSGQANFDNSNLELGHQVVKLVRELGYSVTYIIHTPKFNGKECADSMRVCFKPREEVVNIPYKKNKLKLTDELRRNTWHYIKEIIPVESRPVRCITVDSPDSLYLCGNSLIPTHNTTTITIYALWMACFQKDKRITIVANKEATAKEIFARIKLAYEQLPIYLKPAIKSWRKDGLQLSNDSEIKISTTSASSARGSSSNLLIIDEMAHCPQEIMKELWKSAIPIITASEKSQIVVISTPNGTDNKFYELYQESQKESSVWNLERVEWTDVPGRDETWKKKAIDLLGGNEDDFNQEYGNVFNVPGKSLIDARYLAELKAQCPEPVLVTDDGCYKIFHLPKADSYYVVGVDVGEGIGRSNTVAQVFDVSDLQNIQQVAVYASNTINPYHFGSRLMNILNDWGRPPVLVESNNFGQQVLDVLNQTHNYENIVSYQPEANNKQYKTDLRRGILNNTNTRYNGITSFRYWCNSLKVVKFNDPETLFELNNFVRLPNYTFSKRTDKDLDDRVFGSIWALFILIPNIVSSYFYVNEYNDQGQPNKISPLIDNKDLILKSPLLQGTVSNAINSKNRSSSYLPSYMPMRNVQEFIMQEEARNLWTWIHTMECSAEELSPKSSGLEESNDEHRPIILF